MRVSLLGGIGGRSPQYSIRRTGFAASEDADQVSASLQVFRPENPKDFQENLSVSQGEASEGDAVPFRLNQPPCTMLLIRCSVWLYRSITFFTVSMM